MSRHATFDHGSCRATLGPLFAQVAWLRGYDLRQSTRLKLIPSCPAGRILPLLKEFPGNWEEDGDEDKYEDEIPRYAVLLIALVERFGVSRMRNFRGGSQEKRPHTYYFCPGSFSTFQTKNRPEIALSVLSILGFNSKFERLSDSLHAGVFRCASNSSCDDRYWQTDRSDKLADWKLTSGLTQMSLKKEYPSKWNVIIM